MTKYICHFVVWCASGFVPIVDAPVSAAPAEEDCIAVHAAYDVGSSTTKVKVATVDRCDGTVLEVLLDESESVGYLDDLSRSGDGALSDQVRRRGLTVLRELQEMTGEHEPTVESGVATEAFREADNGEAFLRTLRETTGIDLRIISDEEEAVLGFEAAVVDAGLDPEHAVVWDIGGGSMQVTARAPGRGAADESPIVTENGADYVYYEGRTASTRFRHRIIREIQGHDLEQVRSPNPISSEVAEQALALARELASDLPQPLDERMRDPQVTVLGIGGVHYHAIPGQVELDEGPYTRRQVAEVLEQRIGMSDEEIGGPYASGEVSNLILVLGYMEAWDVDAVQPIQATMSDGLLLRETQRESSSR